ncbi:flagellar biosynthesis protein FlhB [Mariprofundus ferrooxydans]|uniref:Flagellar biosynthetic protein FlhB n=1 Tax=Mariprofundus ferrooxydans PV-1 TaxID=314345 RepID=Q0EZ55_9PROT|nr:flagellar biosynthesis protein FlhB [Mariprofundus ferrooxydans]EAU54569.1 flagellar biosynthesis protein [Mariprofundus ferrooxydans PV-1]KON48822.1 flagellar biosynthesis protein [Mariprofundus ferrooxydans]
MADEQDKSQQTEEATPKREEDARKKGQIATSKEPSTAIAFTVISLIVITGLGSWFGEQMQHMLTNYLSGAVHIKATGEGMQKLLISAVTDMAMVVLPIAVPIMLLGLLVTFMVSGPVFTFETMIPKFEKISPLKGIKRLFSTKALAEFIKSVLKLVLISVACATIVSGMFSEILHTALKDPADIAALTLFGSVKITTLVAVIFVVIALADVLYQRWEHAKSLRMSKKEQRDEHKDSEGDPQLKAKIRQIQMQQAQNRMMSDVPDADVIITNPTHISIALAYDPLSPGAPRVLAKGKGHLAAKIREIAREHHIPMRENKPLARSLFKQVKVGDEIPEVLFEAIAIILAEIFRLKQR